MDTKLKGQEKNGNCHLGSLANLDLLKLAEVGILNPSLLIVHTCRRSSLLSLAACLLLLFGVFFLVVTLIQDANVEVHILVESIFN